MAASKCNGIGCTGTLLSSCKGMDDDDDDGGELEVVLVTCS